MKAQKYIEFFEMCIGVIVIACGISFMIKSGLGQTAYAALATNLSKVIGYKVGTFLIIFNVACVFGQMIILGRNFQRYQILQILVAYLNGHMVNVFCYEFSLISNLAPNNYAIQWLLLISGVLVCSFGVAIMSNVDSLKMPLEELAIVISQKIGRSFPTVRQSLDVMSILGCFVMIFLFKLDYSSLREGTWCSMLLLGRSMAYTFPVAKKALQYINRDLFKLEQAVEVS